MKERNFLYLLPDQSVYLTTVQHSYHAVRVVL